MITTSWAVNDLSTLVLMGAFFEEVSTLRSGAAPDYGRALWAAKKRLRNDPEWSHPYFWAPFALSGRR